MWFPFLIAWAFKTITLRMGGSKTYEQYGVPTAVGFTLGCLAITVLTGIIIPSKPLAHPAYRPSMLFFTIHRQLPVPVQTMDDYDHLHILGDRLGLSPPLHDGHSFLFV